MNGENVFDSSLRLKPKVFSSKKIINEDTVYLCEMITAVKGDKKFTWFYEGDGLFSKDWLGKEQWDPVNFISAKDLCKQLVNSLEKGWEVNGLSKDGEVLIGR